MGLGQRWWRDGSPDAVGAWRKRFQRQQAGHGVAYAVGVLQAAAQHHVAAAFAKDRGAARRSGRKPSRKRSCRQRAGMQLGIAAGQVDRVGIAGGASSASGENGSDLGARRAPAIQQMRIGKGEGGIPRDGDALAERRQGGRRCPVGGRCAGRARRSRRRGRYGASTASAAWSRKLSSASCSPACTRPRWRLGQRQGVQCAAGCRALGMPRRARARAESGASWLGPPIRLRITPAIVDVRPECGEALDQGCGRLGLPLHVEHQHHRPARAGRLGRRSSRVPSAAPSNRPMTPSTTRRSAAALRQPGQCFRPHRPGVEIEAGPPAGGGMEGGIDIIGADLAARRP